MDKQKIPDVSLIFTNRPLDNISDNTEVISWPDDVFTSSPVEGSLYLGLYKELFEALSQHKYQKALKILSKKVTGYQIQCEADSCELYRYIEQLNASMKASVVRVLDGNRLEVSLLLNDCSDPQENIRIGLLRLKNEVVEECENLNTQSVSGIVMDDLIEHDDDQFDLSNEVLCQVHVKDTDKPQQFYFPAQEYIADRIIDRIEVILRTRQNKTLKDFDKFHFQIYTFNSAMLEQQTIKRLCERQAQCFPTHLYESSKLLREEAKRRVKKYVLSKDVDARHRELQKIARDPKTLVLIVADEAHWGITNDATSKKKETANNKLVNFWEDEQHPNVVVLLVSATPFNLLTDQTRIYVDTLYAHLNGEPVILDSTKGHRYFYKGKDVTAEIDRPRHLHHVKWCESFETKLRGGIVSKLKTPLKDRISWLHIQPTPLPGEFALAVSKDSKEAMGFMLKGDKGKVRITSIDEKLILGVKQLSESLGHSTRTDHILRFLHLANCEQPPRHFHTEFLLHSECGQDMFLLQSTKSQLKESYLHCDKNYISLGRQPANTVCQSLPVYPRDYVFLIESPHSVDEMQPSKEYLSLNYYYNTMRVTTESLLRNDEHFNSMCRQLKNLVIDDILAAEYSYYILLMKDIETLDRQLIQLKTDESGWRQVSRLCEQFLQEKMCKFRKFTQELDDQQCELKNFVPIALDVFQSVSGYLLNKARDAFCKSLKDTAKQESLQSTQTVWKAALSMLVHGKGRHKYSRH